MAKSEKSELRTKPTAGTDSKKKKKQRKKERRGLLKGGGEAKRRIWREPLAKRRQPTIFFFLLLTFRSNAGFLSFPFSLSLRCLFSPLDYARLLYSVSLSLRPAALSRAGLKFCPLSIDSSLIRRLYDIQEMRQIILQGEKHR